MAISYRDRGRYGAHVFLCRLEDDTTLLDKQGEPERFSYEEACRIDKGIAPEVILKQRKPLDKSAPVEAEPAKRGPGRPAKEG